MDLHIKIAGALTLAAALSASAMTLEEFIAASKQRCASFGFPEGSEGNARCVQERVERAQAHMARNRDAERRCAGEITGPRGNLDLSAEQRCRANPDRYFANKEAQQQRAQGVVCQLVGNMVSCL